MSAPTQDFIAYIRDCYENDQRQQTIWNLLSRSIESLHITKLDNTFPIPENYFRELKQSQTSHFREKRIYYSPGVVLAKNTDANFNGLGVSKLKNICAPITLYEVELFEEGDGFHVTVLTNTCTINGDILTQIEPSNETQQTLINNHQTQIDAAKNIAIKLGLKPAELNGDITPNKIKQHLKGVKKSQIEYLSIGLLFIAKQPQSQRGTLYELDEMSNSKCFSAPVNKLLSEEFSSTSQSVSDSKNIPGILSTAQARALNNAAKSALSLINGPPGTGKSHTIASMALDRFMAGESVLIVSQNEHAVDVVLHKLIEDFSITPKAMIRGGSNDYLKRLKAEFSRLTETTSTSQKAHILDSNEIDNSIAKAQKIEERFIRSCKSTIDFGRELYKHQKVNFFRKAITAIPFLFKKLKANPNESLLNLINELYISHNKREELLSTYISKVYLRRINEVLLNDRATLVNFSKSIRARSSGTQASYQSRIRYNSLLKALPIWLSSISKLHKLLPLTKELFDLVIIDEASQCNIALALPALQRAKRAVIVGDSKQLNHLSFLARSKETQLQVHHKLTSKHKISYRDNSILDFANETIKSQNSITFLDEHYRSHPQIINFSNITFYNSQLRLMTDHPSVANQAITINFCNGIREEGINNIEAMDLITELKNIVNNCLKQDKTKPPSIGVLCFFREQSGHLRELLYSHLPIDIISKFEILVGTPYFFQGEERDIMLISCGVDNSSTGNVYRYLNREDVFNVAITRARQKQIIFVSAALEKIPKDHLLHQYIKYTNEYTTSIPTHRSSDVFENQVSELFIEQGCNVFTGQNVAGIPIDILATIDDRVFLIDLIGHQGEYESHYRLNHYKILNRAGYQLIPVSWPSWILHHDKTRTEIIETINRGNTLLPSADELLEKSHRKLEIELLLQDNTRGVEQLQLAQKLHASLIQQLNERLNKNEITYLRHKFLADQAFSNIIDNLNLIAINHQYIIEFTEGKEHPDQKHSENESPTQLHINTLYDKNSEAITALKQTVETWLKLPLKTRLSTIELEETLQELTRLINTVDKLPS